MLSVNSRLFFEGNRCWHFQCRFLKKLLETTNDHNNNNINNNNRDDDHDDTPNAQCYNDFRKSLKTQTEFVYRDGYTCLQLPCKLCCYRKDRKDRKDSISWAYVNKRTGVFICPPCRVRIPLSVAIKHYFKHGETSPSSLITEGPEFILDPGEVKQRIEPSTEVLERLAIKGLKLADLELLKVTHHPARQTLHFPLRNVLGEVVGEQQLQLLQGTTTDETHPKQNCSGLLVHEPSSVSSSSSTSANRAILVSSLKDFLVLIAQRLEGYAIICLPYNLRTLPQECLPVLERFRSLTLWLNYEHPNSWDMDKHFANKLNEKRCYLIRSTVNEPSPLMAQQKRFNIRQILARATPLRHQSIVTFSHLRDEVLSELQNVDKVNGVRWKRFPILNRILKGHRRGELTIVTGPTGSGKTTFVSEYSLDLLMQGVSTLWGSFEIRNSRLASTMLRQFVGYSLEKRLDEFDHWATQLEQYPLFFMTFHGQQPLKLVLEAIEHAHYVHDINHVIIDNLQFMMGIGSTPSRLDKFWEQDNIVSAFRTMATKHHIHVTLVMHPRKEREENDLTASSIFGSAKATQEADNVLIIQDKRLTTLRGKKYLQIVKNRYSGELGIMPLDFNKEGLSYASVTGSKGSTTSTTTTTTTTTTTAKKRKEKSKTNIDPQELPNDILPTL